MAGGREPMDGEASGERSNALPPPPAPQFPPPVPRVPPPARRFSLRDKAPELAVEAAFVVFAVLLALGVDGWQERRREQRRADHARESILAEIVSNRAQVGEAIEEGDSLRRDIARATAQMEASDTGTVDLGFELPILSTAAWSTAQTTGATQHLPFEWLLRVAQIYETQAVYARTSAQVLDRFADAITSLESGEGPGALTGMRSSLNIATNIAISLVAAYDSLLAAEGRPPAAPVVDSLEPNR